MKKTYAICTWSDGYESNNVGLWIFDGSYGGNSFYDGLNPLNHSDYYSTYRSFGFGISPMGFPIGGTKNKGKTWIPFRN